jgi:hypothetical protein
MHIGDFRKGPLFLVVSASAGFALAHVTSAQEMDDGEARVRSRSDVEMRVDSGPATNSQRLARLAGLLGPALSTVKQCYAEALEERPTVEGTLKVEVGVPERGPARIKVTSDEVGDKPVVRCATRALERVDYRNAPRPANALVLFTFTHTAAAGVHATRERTARTATVTRNADGLPQARFATPGKEVRFTVTGQKSDSDERVSAARAGLRAAVPGLLDCRRKAGKRDRSPEGEVEVTFLVSGTGQARAQAVRSTVENPIARTCVVRAVGQAKFDRSTAGRWSAVVQFAPYADEESVAAR